MRVFNYLRCYMNITSYKPAVYYNGQPLETFDAASSPALPHLKPFMAQQLSVNLKSWGS